MTHIPKPGSRTFVKAMKHSSGLTLAGDVPAPMNGAVQRAAIGNLKPGSRAYNAAVKAAVGALQATVPAAFAAGDWTLTDNPTPGMADITLVNIPNDGGSPLTKVQVKNGSGSWFQLSGVVPGVYSVGFPGGVLASVTLRAVNAVGNGPASDIKTITPTAMDAEPGQHPAVEEEGARAGEEDGTK